MLITYMIHELLWPKLNPLSSSDDDDDGHSVDEEVDEEVDEPPPPIPLGMTRTDWDGSGRSVRDSMYWACIDGAPTEWHTGLVVRHLKPGRRD
eukprot:1112743-Pleurochrysis_carterae.AAC.2